MLSGKIIRLVSFDALYTVLKPRAPISVQYAEAFAEAGLGNLDPDAIGRSFKNAYKLAASTKSVGSGPDGEGASEAFWRGMIFHSAIGAGADADATKAALPVLVPTLMHRFSSDKGYALYDDVETSLTRLRDSSIKIGLLTNSDDRIRSALDSLGVLSHFHVQVISDLEKIAKPDKRVFQLSARYAGVEIGQMLHIGDELENDYHGAEGAGAKALLLRRHGEDGSAAHEDRTKENLEGIKFVPSLTEAVKWIEAYNQQQCVSP